MVQSISDVTGGCLRIPIALISANQTACSGSRQTLPTRGKLTIGYSEAI